MCGAVTENKNWRIFWGKQVTLRHSYLTLNKQILLLEREGKSLNKQKECWHSQQDLQKTCLCPSFAFHNDPQKETSKAGHKTELKTILCPCWLILYFGSCRKSHWNFHWLSLLLPFKILKISSVFPCFHIYNDNDNDYTDYGSSVFSEIVSILRLLSFPWDLILHSSREMYCKPLREMIGKCRRASPM